MAASENNRTETEWDFLPDADEDWDPEEFGEVRLLEEGPRNAEEWMSLGDAMEAGGIDTVVTDEWVWTAGDSMPDGVYSIDRHPFAETVASGWTGGGMNTRFWGLSRIGDLYFQWHDTQTETDAVHRGTLLDAVEASDYFRVAPTGHVVPNDVRDDELANYLRYGEGVKFPDIEQLMSAHDLSFPLAAAYSGHLGSGDSSGDLGRIVEKLLDAGITGEEARTIMLTGCRRNPVPVLHFIRALGPAADELVDRRDDIHDLINWVEGRAESAGISVLEAYDQAPPSTTYPGFVTKSEGAAIAVENRTIIRAGGYESASGKYVDLSAQVASAVEGSRTFTPDELAALPGPSSTQQRGLVTVANETTLIGAMRVDDGNVGCLNFASARSVGGGYLNGSRAQEEALCRESALYPCLASQEDSYHQVNRAADDVVGLWTDAMIHSPNVPVFRSSAWDLLDDPFAVSFVTAPAPNLARVPANAIDLVPGVFERRIDLVFRLFQAMGHRRVVLGAWGCGAFGNDTTMVAVTFRRALDEDGWRWAFDHVHFAVLDFADDPDERATFNAFDRALSGLDLSPELADDELNDVGTTSSDDAPAADQQASWDRNDPKLGTCPKCGKRAFQTVLGGNPMGKAFASSRCLGCGWVQGRQVSGSGADGYAARIRQEQDRWHEEHGKGRPSSS